MLAAVAVGVAVGGCATGTPVGASPTKHRQEGGITVNHQVSATLILDSAAVKAGGVLAGVITVENRTGEVLHASGCGGIFQVLLTSESYRPGPVWPACLGPVTIPTGRSTYPVQVEARYNICGQGGGLRACGSGGAPPPLPTGMYEATAFELGKVVPIPSPVVVRVTA